MKVVDLRRELASRNLPTEGLKQDLAFRLASLDNARVSTALKLSHPTCIPASATSNEDTVTKMENDEELITSVRNKSPERVTPSSQNKLSSPFVRENCQGDKNRRVSNLARMLIAFGTALLLILLITFLSWVLWHYIPTTDKEYLSIILDDVYHFLTSHVNNCQTFLRSQFQNGHHFISRKIQPMVVALMKQVRKPNHPQHTCFETGSN